jgi:pimeloyl-ACP methyl ester carboxylesterase
MGLTRFAVRRGDVVLSGLRGGKRGDAVLLLHGLAGAAEEMIPTAKALLGEHRVIALDQRGHGFLGRRDS